jgi:tRNA pseudouridine55 synthase
MGLWLLHKPPGPTSFAAFRAAIERLGLDRAHPRIRACHGGTLDPFAEGLLLVLTARATRLFEPLHQLPKHYEAEVAWGAETDNGDLLGRVVRRAPPPSPVATAEALRAFLGWTDQVPPAHSAKKIGGEPAYRKAHRGEVVELPPSRVYLHAARWVTPTRLSLVVRGGFYVRSLVRDLGRAVGSAAHVSALRRTAIGPWRDPRDLVEADPLVWLRTRGEDGIVHAPRWRPPDGWPAIEAPIAVLKNGRWIAEE